MLVPRVVPAAALLFQSAPDREVGRCNVDLEVIAKATYVSIRARP